MPLFRLYNSSSIAAASVSSEKYSVEARRAGARAVLRHGQHFTDYFSTRTNGGLHPWYLGVHGLGGQNKLERKEIDNLISDSLHDTIDSISTLDWIDGGISFLVRCPGYKIPTKFTVEDITVDIYISPRDLADGGTEMSKAIALMVQSFGENIALPHLQRFQSRCAKEGVKAPTAPRMPFVSYASYSTDKNDLAVPGASSKAAGQPCLPAPVVNSGPYVRCKCRQVSTLAQLQDIILITKLRQPLSSRHAPQPPIDITNDIDIPVSEEWIREASVIAAQYDDPVQPSSATHTKPTPQEQTHEASVIATQSDDPVQPSSAIHTKPTPQERIREASASQSDDPVQPSSAIQTKPTPHQNREDGFQGAIVSIGLRTDSVLDRFDLDDNLLPRLRVLMQTVRSSRWEAMLRSPDFGLSYEQACKLSEAMLKDIGVEPDLQHTKSTPAFYGSPIFLILLTVFATIIAIFIAVPYI